MAGAAAATADHERKKITVKGQKNGNRKNWVLGDLKLPT